MYYWSIVSKMKHIGVYILSLVTLGCSAFNAYSIDETSNHESVKQALAKRLDQHAFVFRQNHGQWDDESLYKAVVNGQLISFYSDRIEFIRQSNQRLTEPDSSGQPPQLLSEVDGWAIYLSGANSRVDVVGSSSVNRNIRYFTSGVRSNKINEYKQITYQNVYPGIDMTFYTHESGQLKYDFIVQPGANPELIELEYVGVNDLKVDFDGSLQFTSKAGSWREGVPLTFQETGSVRTEVAANYRVEGSTLRFEVGDYNTDRVLVIDPIYVDWSTYFYGEKYPGTSGTWQGYTWVFDVDMDDKDNVYVTGITNQVYPKFDNVYDSSLACNGNSCFSYDAFVAKMSNTGDSLLWFTYIGGSSYEWFLTLAVNELQQPVITGVTASNNYPTTSGAYDTDFGGNNGFNRKLFVTKFTKEADSLIFSTYFGGDNGTWYENVTAIELDSDGDVYLVGQTTSTDWPTTANAYEDTYGGGSWGGSWAQSRGDGFLSILNADGSNLLYSSYIGGAGDESVRGIFLDSDEKIFLVGGTNSSNFPTTPGFSGFNQTPKNEDGFIMKFEKGGSKLIYSHLVGGAANDRFSGIYVNSFDEAYVAGISSSSDFYVTKNAYQKKNAGGVDLVICKFNKFGSNFHYSTYLGGSSAESPNTWSFYSSDVNIAANIREEAIICGQTQSSNFPVTSDALQDTNKNNGMSTWANTACIAKLSMDGSRLLYGSYWGGTRGEISSAVKLKRYSCFTHIVYGGITYSGDFPVSQNPWKDTAQRYGTWWSLSGFVSKFRDTLYTETIDLKFGDTLVECDNVFEPLDAKNQGADFLWSTGHTGRYYIVKDTGELWVQATYGCDTVRDTLQVVLEYSPTMPVLPGDSLYCDTIPDLVLDAKHDTIRATYEWQDASTNQTYSTNQPGKYWVTVHTPNCGSKTDSINIRYLETPEINLPDDSTFCDSVNMVINLNESDPSRQFAWSTLDSVASIHVKDTGTYWAKAYNACGFDSAQFTALQLLTPVVQLPNDTLYCNDFTLGLKVGVSNNNEFYQWDEYEQGLVIGLTDSVTLSDPGSYVVKITNKCATVKDSITLRRLDPPSVKLPEDDTLCNTILIDLVASDPNSITNQEGFLWNDNSTDTMLRVTAAGKYWVQVSNDCGTDSDTVVYSIKYNPQFSLGSDSVYCNAVKRDVDITQSEPTSLYFLNDVPFSGSTTLDQEGTYWFKIENYCGEYEEDITLGLLTSPSAQLPEDKVFCGAVTATTLDVPDRSDNEESILWSDQSIGTSTVFTTEGKHWVQISNRCGVDSDTILFSVSNYPEVDLGEDTVLCGNFAIQLDAGYNPNYTYEWKPYGETSYSIFATEQVTYSVTVTNADGCESGDDFTVGSGCVSYVHIPDAFTPNQDGVNESFKPVLVNTQNFSMEIYNRWGERIFVTTDPNEGWDGTYQGKACDDGVYVYQIILETTEDLQPRNYSGVVNLVR
jgi:gliding motility-associated-like protein